MSNNSKKVLGHCCCITEKITFFLYSAIAAKFGFMRPSCSSSFVIWTRKSSSSEISSAICCAFNSGSGCTGLLASIWCRDSLPNYKCTHALSAVVKSANKPQLLVIMHRSVQMTLVLLTSTVNTPCPQKCPPFIFWITRWKINRF